MTNHPNDSSSPVSDLCVLLFLQAPVYALIVLGCYGLVSVGYALFTFRDCPEKREQLSRDIVDAEVYLKQKGFVAPPPPAGWKA